MFGLSALSPEWLRALELRDVADRLATDLYASAVLGESLPEYPPN